MLNKARFLEEPPVYGLVSAFRAIRPSAPVQKTFIVLH